MSSDLSEQTESCSDQGNQYPFCSPISSDVWLNGTTHNFVWNWNYPFYVDSERLSLYLYHYIKFEYINVKNYTDLDRRSGGIQVAVDDSWFLSPLEDGAASKNWTMMGFYLPAGANPAVELASPTSGYPRPFNFTVTQLSKPNSNNPNSSNTTTTNTSNSNETHLQSTPTSSSTSLPGWAIAVIVIGIIGLLCGAAALIWALFLSRNGKNGTRRNNKLIPIMKKLQIDNDDNGSMNSKARMTGGGTTNAPKSSMENMSSVGSLASSRPLSPLNTPFIPSTPPPRPPPMPVSPSSSANDWHSYYHQSQTKIGSSSGNSSFIISTTEEDEELRRRRLGEALLQRQLAEDGTSVKHAGRLTRVRSLADVKKKATIVESAISQRQHSILSSSSSISSNVPTTSIPSSQPLPTKSHPASIAKY